MWSPILPPDPDSRQPTSRCKHAMCLYRGSIYMYGGRDGNRSLKDLWKYNLVSGKWTEIWAKGDRPGCLEEHSLVAYKGALYAFGGEFSYASVGDIPLWMLNLETNIWEKPRIESKVAPPSGRRGHTTVICNDAMHVYGGYIDLKGSNSEFWTYNFEKNCWHLNYNQQMIPDGPGARHCHSAVIYDQAMWVYGGMNDLNARGDFWKWNFQFKQWSRIRSKPNPPELHGHSACKVSDGILLFGGENNGNLSHDIWKFQFRTQTWFKLQVQGPQAPGRTRHVSLLVTSLHFNLLNDTPHNSPLPAANFDKRNLSLPPADSTERSYSAPHLKKTSLLTSADLDNRPYSSPPVITSDSPTHKRFKNKIQPNKKDGENGEECETGNHVKGWEINREQFVAKKSDGKDTCRDPMIEMTELVPLIRPKITHSSTFDSCDSIKGFENMGFRKSSDGSMISNAWDDAQASSTSRKYERCNSLDALKEMAHETNISPVHASSDKSDKRLSLPLEQLIGNDSENICDNSDLDSRRNTFHKHGHLMALDETANILSKLNMDQSGKKGKDFRLSNIYHGNLIDLSTVIRNPDPEKMFMNSLVSSSYHKDVTFVQNNQRIWNRPIENSHSSTDTSSSNTPTRDTSSACSSCGVDSHDCNTIMKLTNCHFVSPSTTFKSNLPGFVKSGSLDSMKQLKLFRMHATRLGSSDESSCHDDVFDDDFLEDFESFGNVSDDEIEPLTEEAQLIKKSVNKTTRHKCGQNGHDPDLEVGSEKVPLIVQGQRTKQSSVTISKEMQGDACFKKREQVQRQVTAPPLGFKNRDEMYNNSVSTMITFGGREQEAQYLRTKPISVWKYTFKEEIVSPFYDVPNEPDNQ